MQVVKAKIIYSWRYQRNYNDYRDVFIAINHGFKKKSFCTDKNREYVSLKKQENIYLFILQFVILHYEGDTIATEVYVKHLHLSQIISWCEYFSALVSTFC